jgi:uncharacterized protein (TIGR02246 family)
MCGQTDFNFAIFGGRRLLKRRSDSRRGIRAQTMSAQMTGKEEAMSKPLSAIIGLIAFAIATPSHAHDQAEAEKAVAAIVATYIEKYNSKDAAGVAALYAEDGILVPPGPMVAGRANIERAWQASFDAGRTGIRYDIKQIKPEGNIVLVVGQFTVKVPEGGSLQDRPGNFVNIYQWDGGALKFHVHSFSFMPSPR